MADIYDISEIRNIVSVLEDGFADIEASIATIMPDQLTTMQQEILDGKRLVKGQLVYLQSTDTVNVLGIIPAIVTKITKTTITNIKYDFTVLTGDLIGELTNVILEDTKIAEAIKVDIPIVERDRIINAIKNTHLGSNDLRETKIKLGIKHIFSLDTANSNFVSYF